jgi:hypothetical protein
MESSCPYYDIGGNMPNEQKSIRIELTSEQQALLKEQTGIDVQSVELTIEELESRIAPTSLNYGGVHYTYNP